MNIIQIVRRPGCLGETLWAFRPALADSLVFSYILTAQLLQFCLQTSIRYVSSKQVFSHLNRHESVEIFFPRKKHVNPSEAGNLLKYRIIGIIPEQIKHPCMDARIWYIYRHILQLPIKRFGFLSRPALFCVLTSRNVTLKILILFNHKLDIWGSGQ